MYICNCQKGHDLNKDDYKLLQEGKELHLKCIDCDWEIIVGADEFEDGYSMYSYAVETEQDTIGRITSIRVGVEV